jgi:hypothetical protein
MAKVFQTANTSNLFATLPTNLDQLVDIDSVQTMVNKSFTGPTAFTGEIEVAGWIELEDASATAPVSDPGAANLMYSQPAQALMISINGGPYVNLTGSGAIVTDLQRKFRLLLKTVAAGLGLNMATLQGIGGQVLMNEVFVAQQTI